MTFILYGDKSSGAFSVECALKEVGHAYELRSISLANHEQKSAEFLAINPTGKLPALVLDDGHVLTESLAILLTIAERDKQGRLLPPYGSSERAQCLRWLAFLATEVYPMIELVDYPERFAPDAPDGLKEKAAHRFRERVLVAEKAVAGPWLLQSGFSVADIYLAMFSRWIKPDWRHERLPKIRDLTRALKERPALEEVWQRHFGS